MHKLLSLLIVASIFSCDSNQIQQKENVIFNQGTDTINLGTLVDDTVVNFSFTIENNTRTVVEIKGIEGSCSCVNFRYQPIIQENSGTQVEGSYTMKSKQSLQAAPQKIIEAISIRTSDTSKPIKVLYVVGQSE